MAASQFGLLKLVPPELLPILLRSIIVLNVTAYPS